MRSKPDGSCPGIRPGTPRSRASGYDRVQAGIGVGADGMADDVDSAGSRGVARTPTSFVNSRLQCGAYDIDTLTAAVKTAKARRSSTCRIVPVKSTTIRLTPRFRLLGALSGRCAGRPATGRPKRNFQRSAR
jgi:hypothetical protein